MDGEICSLLEVSQSPLCVRDYNKSISTTSQRQAAFARFRKYDTSRVLAWLEDFHLLQPDHQHQSCSAYLNQQELDALSASRVCHDDHISEWLRLSTPIVPAGIDSPLQSPYDSSQSFCGFRLHTAQRESSSGSLAFPSPYTPNSSQPIGSTSWSRGEPYRGIHRKSSVDGTASPASASGEHPYWCTLCEDPQLIYTCDGWKKHMKEHETIYPCLLCVPMEHLASSQKYTSKIHLTKSLIDAHDVAQDSDLAEGWRHTRDSNILACRCYSCVSAMMTDHLDHINNFRYKRLEDINIGDHIEVLLDLSSHSEPKEARQRTLASHSLSEEPPFTWNPSLIVDLQLQLELREMSIVSLAKWALTSSNIHRSQHVEGQSGIPKDGTEWPNGVNLDLEASVFRSTNHLLQSIEANPANNQDHRSRTSASHSHKSRQDKSNIPSYSSQLDVTSSQTLPPAPKLQDIHIPKLHTVDKNSDLGVIQSPFQPFRDEVKSISPNIGSTHMFTRNYLDGIGAWQASPWPGFIDVPSSSSASESTGDERPPAYYPNLPNTNTTLTPPQTYDEDGSEFIQCPKIPLRDRSSSFALSDRIFTPMKSNNDDLEMEYPTSSICDLRRYFRRAGICPNEIRDEN